MFCVEEQRICQKIAPYCANLSSAMKEEKKKQRKTNQDIIDSTGLSPSTVNKFFAGSLPDPSVSSAAAIAIDLGLSLDSLMGIKEAPQDSSSQIQRLESEIAHRDELLRKTEEQVALLQERSDLMVAELERKEADMRSVRAGWKPIVYGMCGLSILLALFLFVYVFLDARNPDIGLIRRSASSPIVYLAAMSIIGVVLYIGHTFVKKRMERLKNADHSH